MVRLKICNICEYNVDNVCIVSGGCCGDFKLISKLVKIKQESLPENGCNHPSRIHGKGWQE